MVEIFDVMSPVSADASGISMEGAAAIQATAGATGSRSAVAGANGDRGNTQTIVLRD